MPQRDWQDDRLLRPRGKRSLRAHFDAMRTRTKRGEGWHVLCPECHEPILEREQPEHLMAAHGYLPLSGILLPRTATLACLWDRVFSTGDPHAHEQLCQLLTPPSNYAAALKAELRQRIKSLFANRQELEQAVRHLRQYSAARTHFWHLLTANEPRVQDVGRELLLPDVGETLANAQSGAEVRDWVEKLCPSGDAWDKARICRRLPNYGAAEPPVRECLRQLQAERPVACPECGNAVPQDQLENHLRQVHRIHQFQGVRLTREETVAALLTAVCSSKTDYDAWENLEALAREEYGAHAEVQLATWVRKTLESLPPENRQEAMRASADAIAGSSGSQRITEALAGSHPRLARQLALTLVARLLPPPDEALRRALLPLLVRKRAPRSLQIEAAAALLRATTGKGDLISKGTGPVPFPGREAATIVETLIAHCGKARALYRLRRLEQQTGQIPAITERCLLIQRRIRMRCPRCHIQLRHPEMTLHLWTEHALLLDGLRARTPWRLIGDWIETYHRSKNAELLIRCRMLGQRLDPEGGLHRVYRMFLEEGVEDIEARQVLSAKAKQRHASLCPHCYALVPVPDEIIPRPLNESHGRLSYNGYCVEVEEKGLRPQLTMETPDSLVFRGPEPGRWLTRKWSALFLAGPPVVAALGYALLAKYPALWRHVFNVPIDEYIGYTLPQRGWEAVLQRGWPVEVGILLALVLYLVVRLHWWARPKLADRAVDHAWSDFVPRLCAKELPVESSAFLAGLALTSLQHGRPDVRAESLHRALHYVENAARGGDLPLAHLAALKRLQMADGVTAGLDLMPKLAADIGRCFAGELPLIFAQQLLEDRTANWWTPGNLARLRILLCDRAFEAGSEMRDLIEAGHNAPALGSVLHTDDPDGLAQLRLLWSLRPRRPWDRWSDPATVFELANEPNSGARLVTKYPDLLLADRAWPAVYICGRGLIFKEFVFAEPPRKLEMKARRDFARVDYEVVVDEHRFPFASDPSALVNRLERWFRYYFNDFRPQVSGVHSWQAPTGRNPVQYRETVRCPDCGRSVVTILGQVGSENGR